MDSVIVNNISKWYGKERFVAVDNVSFNVAKGEIFGLIGPDGAGKTSLFRVLTTLLLPDGGKAEVDGMDVVKDFRKIRQVIGYMPGRFSLYQDLTVEENLTFFATIFKTTIRENYHLIKDIYSQLEPFKDRRAGKLSGGMKQKLALSCALIHKPTVLFLDEPTTGVDPVSRKEFWEMLHRLKDEGITILVSTPYMDEASQCDRIALMQKSRILAINTPKGIIDSFNHELFRLKSENTILLLKELKKLPGKIYAYPFGEHIHVTFSHDEFNERELRKLLDDAQYPHLTIEPVKASVEDCFIHQLRS